MAAAVVVLELHEQLLVVCLSILLAIADGVVEDASCGLRRRRVRRVAQHSAKRRRPGGQSRLAFTPPHLQVKRVIAVFIEALCKRANLRDAGYLRQSPT